LSQGLSRESRSFDGFHWRDQSEEKYILLVNKLDYQEREEI